MGCRGGEGEQDYCTPCVLLVSMHVTLHICSCYTIYIHLCILNWYQLQNLAAGNYTLGSCWLSSLALYASNTGWNTVNRSKNPAWSDPTSLAKYATEVVQLWIMRFSESSSMPRMHNAVPQPWPTCLCSMQVNCILHDYLYLYKPTTPNQEDGG